MICKETTSIEDIEAVLCHPEIYPTITDDNSPPVEDYEPPITDHYRYIGGYVENEIVALMIYHRHQDGCKCHIQVIPTHRAKQADKFMVMALGFRLCDPLYGEVPELYQNVINFAESHGFTVIGETGETFFKGGKSYTTKLLRYDDGVC